MPNMCGLKMIRGQHLYAVYLVREILALYSGLLHKVLIGHMLKLVLYNTLWLLHNRHVHVVLVTCL